MDFIKANSFLLMLALITVVLLFASRKLQQPELKAKAKRIGYISMFIYPAWLGGFLLNEYIRNSDGFGWGLFLGIPLIPVAMIFCGLAGYVVGYGSLFIARTIKAKI